MYETRSFAVLTVVLLALLASPAWAQGNPGPPSGDGVQPSWHDGNPRCTDLGYSTGCKMDPPRDGVIMCSGVEFVVDVSGRYVAWTSDGTAAGVIVKGGPNANLFVYVPADDGDTQLHAPVNPNNGQLYGLSHISFCDAGGPPPPPPPPPPTGSCCLDCDALGLPDDVCHDGVTEAWCDDQGGRWGGSDCSNRQDCSDTCSVPALPPPALAGLALLLMLTGSVVARSRLRGLYFGARTPRGQDKSSFLGEPGSTGRLILGMAWGMVLGALAWAGLLAAIWWACSWGR